jgi:hypothetical protein
MIVTKDGYILYDPDEPTLNSPCLGCQRQQTETGFVVVGNAQWLAGALHHSEPVKPGETLRVRN